MKYFVTALLLASLNGTSQTLETGATSENVKPAIIKNNMPVGDVYAIAPTGFTGGGFGLGGFSPALPTSLLGFTELRIGGDFYFTGLDRRTMRDVPLLAPQSGLAKVKLYEHTFGLNLTARVSMPWRYKVSPYIDGFAGLRAVTNGISITPNDYQPGYEENTSDNLDAAFAFQYGATGGVLISLGKDIKLNMGVMYSRSDWPGMLKDIHSATLVESGIRMNKKELSRDMFMFKLGITFRITPDENGRRDRCDCCGSRVSTVGVMNPGVWRPARAANRIGTGKSTGRPSR